MSSSFFRCSYSDDVGCHDQRNVNKKQQGFKIKLAVTMTSPEERQNDDDDEELELF